MKQEVERGITITHKQETLEETAETELYITINKIIDGGKDLPKGHNVTRGQAVDYAFETALKITKWQQERMYSEEEVGELLYNVIGEYGKHYGIMIDGKMLNDLFEQFKK